MWNENRCHDSKCEDERNLGRLGVMTDAAANDSLSFCAHTPRDPPDPTISLCSLLLLSFFKNKTKTLPVSVQSGVDSDDLAPSSSDQ